MMPQEREMIATLVERLKKAEGQPKDPDAEALIRQATAAQQEAPYSLVQTALIPGAEPTTGAEQDRRAG
jgi:hypothetical protein